MKLEYAFLVAKVEVQKLETGEFDRIFLESKFKLRDTKKEIKKIENIVGDDETL
ncbi:MAG: hypothetical protein IPK55_12800 [Streptococcus sp.]|nr:hypothetical protein [Streptococcus sp.]